MSFSNSFGCGVKIVCLGIFFNNCGCKAKIFKASASITIDDLLISRKEEKASTVFLLVPIPIPIPTTEVLEGTLTLDIRFSSTSVNTINSGTLVWSGIYPHFGTKAVTRPLPVFKHAFDARLTAPIFP